MPILESFLSLPTSSLRRAVLPDMEETEETCLKFPSPVDTTSEEKSKVLSRWNPETTESLIPLSSWAFSFALSSLASIRSAWPYSLRRSDSNFRAAELALERDPRERSSFLPS